jgi:hypothetical protein
MKGAGGPTKHKGPTLLGRAYLVPSTPINVVDLAIMGFLTGNLFDPLVQVP